MKLHRLLLELIEGLQGSSLPGVCDVEFPAVSCLFYTGAALVVEAVSHLRILVKLGLGLINFTLRTRFKF